MSKRFVLSVLLSALLIPAAARAQTIHLNAGALDTGRAAKLASARATAAESSGDQLHLVQFTGPIQPEWVEQLVQDGYRIVDYIPDHAYLVYGGASALKSMRARATHVQWEGAYLASDKINPLARPEAVAARRAATGSDGLFSVQLVLDEAANAETLALVEALKLAPIRSRSVNSRLRFLNLVAALPGDRLSEVAARPDVVSINVYAPPRKCGERQSQIVAGNLNAAGSQPSGPGYLAWLGSKGFSQDQFDSSGFIVDIADDGWDLGVAATPANREFRKNGSAAEASRVKYSQWGTTLATAGSWGKDGHGNINVSIVGGYNNLTGSPYEDASGYNLGLGVCPFANMGNTKVFDDAGDWAPTDEQESAFISSNYARGVRISSDSWGDSSVVGGYDVYAQNYDTATRDAQPGVAGNQECLFVFAAGNDGTGASTIGTPGTAKNVITVGASENYNQFGTDGCSVGNSGADNANDIIDFSSRGPCKDKRIKPDIVAPGTHIQGAASFYSGYTGEGVCDKYQPAGQTNYAASSGTSHSTPAVAGGSALVYQYFLNQGWGVPSPAMVKAYLMNSTRYLTGVDANDTLPSNKQGMGGMNLGTAFDGTARILRDQLTSELFTASGQTRTYYGMVSDPSKPLRITLGWTDAPGSTTGNAYKNNLDLAVSVGGATYKGNVFSGAHSAAGGAADVRNNVESVFLPAGATGLVQVTVTAFNINSDGVPGYGGALDQDFALVVANATAFTPSNYPPALDAIGNKSIATNKLLQFTVAARDPIDGDVVRLWAEGVPAWATFAGASNAAVASSVFSGTTPEATGTYAVTFFAADKDGTNTESIVITVNDINCVPAVLLTERFDDSTAVPAGWVNGNSVNDTANHYLSPPNARGLGLNTSIQTPPVNNPTQIVFYADASSKGSGQTASLDVRVGTGDWTPVGTFIVSDAGSSVSFGLADLAETANVSFRFNSTFNTWYLDDVVIRGLDCSGGSLPNNAPVLSVAGGTSQNATTGTELSFVVTANDADADPVTLRTNAAPPGAVFPSASGTAPIQGTFAWTPAETGLFTAVFVASDGYASVTQAVSIAVSAPVPQLLAPVIQPASDIERTQFNANWLASEHATGYRLDVATDSEFSGGGASGAVTNLSEDFSGFAAAGSGTDIGASLDDYTQVAGWTGAKVFQDSGTAKLGSSSGKGFLVTPTVDLSANGGAATLTFDLGGYGSDASVVQVLHAANGTTFVQVGADLTPSASLTPQSVEITGGTASSKIQIAAKNLSKNRFYLDNIQIAQSAPARRYVPGYQSRDVGDATTCAVTGLTESVTYYYRVKAYSAASNSPYSGTTNAMTLAATDVPPVFTPLGAQSVVWSNTLSFDVTASDLGDGDEIVLSATDLPDGATFATVTNSTTATGTFQWEDAGPMGVYTPTFWAVDKDGTNRMSVQITVGDGLTPVEIAFQGFEGTASDTWGVTAANHVLSVPGAADTPANQRIRTGSHSWQPGESENTAETLELAEVDVSAYSEVVATLHLSATSTESGYGMYPSEIFSVSLALNGGGYPSEADIKVTGNSLTGGSITGALWSYTATGVAATTAGVSRTMAPASGGVAADGLATIQIALPPGAAAVKLKADVVQEYEGFFWNVDDISLSGIPDGGASDYPPSIAVSPDGLEKTVAVSNNLSFTISATEIPNDAGDEVRIWATGLPAGATFAGATNAGGASSAFSWTPSAAGTYPVSFHAGDKDGTNRLDVSISVYETGAGNKTYGVFVGLNKYLSSYIGSGNWLNGCVPDANHIYTNTIKRGEWTAATVTRLLDSAGTKAAIRAAISNYAAAAVAGDTFFYYHSSHGGQVSGTSVYLCSYNANYLDTELAADLAAFATGVRVVVMVDACHSGGLFKSIQAGTRALVPESGMWDLAGIVTRIMEETRATKIARGTKGVEAMISAGEIGWITAADYNQYSWDGANGGLFTDKVIEGWTNPVPSSCDRNGDSYANFYELYAYASNVANNASYEYTQGQAYNTNVLRNVMAGWIGSSAPGGLVVFSNMTAQTMVVGQTLQYPVGASTSGTNTPATVSMTTVQAGASYAGGVLTFTPTVDGNYSFDFTATNATGGSASATLAVTATLSAPALSAATDVGNDRFTVNWSAVPGAANYLLDVATAPTFSAGGSGATTVLATTLNTALSAGWAYVNGASSASTYHKLVSAGDPGVVSPAFSTAGYTNALASFSVATYGGASANTLTVSYSLDGGVTWTAAGMDSSASSSSPYLARSIALPAAALDQASVRVKWHCAVATDAVGLRLQNLAVSGSQPAGENTLVVSGQSVGTTQYVVTGLGMNTPYYYRVRAVGVLIGPNSTTGTATTTASDTAPSFAAIGEQAAAVGALFTFNVASQVSGYPAPAIALTSSTADEADYSFSAGSLSFTPSETGSFGFVFQASNGLGTAVATVHVAVAAAPILIPTASIADLSSDAFTVNWTATTGGTTYQVQVATDDAFSGGGRKGVLLQEAFASLTDASHPSGWTGSGSSDLDYPSAPYVGAAAPAYKLKASGQWLLSPVFAAGATNLQFFAFGNGSGTPSTIAVSGLVSGAWTLVDTKTIAVSGATYQVTLAPQTTQLKFLFTKNGYNCALDDVLVTGGAGGGSIVLDQTVAALTCPVTGLTPETPYFVRVRATGGDWSPVVSTTTTGGEPRPPVLTPIGNKSVAVTGTLRFQVAATPTDADAVTLTASNLPSGSTFHATNENGTFEWIGASPTGTYSVTFHAADDDGSVSETIAITVSAGTPELLAPIVQAATGAQANRFNANWLASANATGYRLDVATTSDFSTGGGASQTNLSEDFSLFVRTNSSSDVGTNMNAYMHTAGWTGSKIYENVGTAKLGSSSGMGLITTPTVDLSAQGGVATLTFDLGKYGSDVGLVQVMYAPDGTTFAQVGGDLAPPATLTRQTVPITGGTALSKIRITAKAANNNRFYLDNFRITQTAPGRRFVSGYENRDVGDVTTHAVTGLTENVTYYYRVKAYSAASNSPYSGTTSVVTTASSGTPPVLNPIGNQRVFEGETLQFQVSATKTEGDAVTLSISNRPAGAAFYPTNELGTFLWTSASPTGTYQVTFLASDKDGTDVKSISIKVHPQPHVNQFEMSGDSPSAHFTSVEGQQYRLEYTTDLTADSIEWNEADSQTGDGGAITLTDSDPSDPIRYYRLTATP